MWEKIKSLILNKEKRLPPLWWINQKFWSPRMKCSLHWRLYRSQFWVLGGLSKYFKAVLSLQSCKRKRPNWPFLFFFLGANSDCNAGLPQWHSLVETLWPFGNNSLYLSMDPLFWHNCKQNIIRASYDLTEPKSKGVGLGKDKNV